MNLLRTSMVANTINKVDQQQQQVQAQAMKMFLPVVVVLFVCNIGSMINYIIMHFGCVLYREMYIYACGIFGFLQFISQLSHLSVEIFAILK